jgi:hypothetical protein
MTNITDADLTRIEAYCTAAESGPEDLATLLAFWRQARADLPALVAAVREAREALEPLARVARVIDSDRRTRDQGDHLTVAFVTNPRAPGLGVRITVGECRRVARIVESG